MIKKTIILTILACTLAQAEIDPNKGRLDNRMKTLNYQKNEVYKITTHYFIDTMIIFSEDEEIIHSAAGDPQAWDIVSLGNYLSVKPIDDKADTNLNLLTKNKLTGEIKPYAFELRVNKNRGITDNNSTFMINFRYPGKEKYNELKKILKEKKIRNTEVVKGKSVNPMDWNMNYSFAGNTINLPIKVFDDGDFTYFEFSKNTETPAIFIVDDKNNESLVNYHVKGKYIIVQRIAEQFTLRSGDVISCVFNDDLIKGKTL